MKLSDECKHVFILDSEIGKQYLPIYQLKKTQESFLILSLKIQVNQKYTR